MSDSPDELLLACFQAGVAAVRPGPAVESALRTMGRLSVPPWLLAIGKAAAPMARAAVAILHEHNLRPAGGLVVGPDPSPVDCCRSVAGDHPLPGALSSAAASAIESFCLSTPAGAEVWLMLSGGATSLMAGPVEGLSGEDLTTVFDQLQRSGLDIHEMNRVRKRLTRLGGGRLLVALGHANVTQLIVSDVPGDDPATIGSGPCIGDPIRASAVTDSLAASGMGPSFPPAAWSLLQAMACGQREDIPTPEELAGFRCRSRIIGSNSVAIDRARARALREGVYVESDSEFITGEAATAGAHLARILASAPRRDRPTVYLWGSETTVTRPEATGAGGRCQELAMAAALALAGAEAIGVVLLVATTDGRDGPTDAAGAIVTSETASRVAQAGVDPVEALRSHDCYPALDTVGALIRTGLTGTNVMDLIAGWVPAISATD